MGYQKSMPKTSILALMILDKYYVKPHFIIIRTLAASKVLLNCLIHRIFNSIKIERSRSEIDRD